jgi:hypothetical protein
MNLLKDAFGDKSSGILMMVVMFIAAVAIANVGVCFGMELGQLSLLVSIFLVPVVGGQIGQAIQGLPCVPSSPNDKPQSLGVFHNPLGTIDVGRVLKLAAVLVAMELAILLIILRKDASLTGIAEICGVFLAYSTASEIAQKAGHV